MYIELQNEIIQLIVPHENFKMSTKLLLRILNNFVQTVKLLNTNYQEQLVKENIFTKIMSVSYSSNVK